MIPGTTQQSIGTVRHGDFDPGHVTFIKGSAFVNSIRNIRLRLNSKDSDSDRSQKFIRKRIQKAVQ
jgi:4-hydroxyphenylpyruvate dioxygenase-like putative hemolysin